MLNGTLYSSCTPANLGEANWNELNIIEPGGNYGWPHYEGAGGDPNYMVALHSQRLWESH